MIPQRGQVRGKSARRRKLWLWGAGISLAAVAATLFTVRHEQAREETLADARHAVSTQYADAAVAEESAVRFKDVTEAAGLKMTPLEPPRARILTEDNGAGLAWGDYDGDGWVDLYVVRHTGGSRLFHNNRDGTFSDVTAASGVGNRDGWGMGASWVDYDDDGWLDLFVTNRGRNRLYHNRGDGTFEEVGARAGLDDAQWGAGAAWGDFDRDGRIDLYLCNYVSFDAAVVAGGAAVPRRGGYEAPLAINPSAFDSQPNRLYRNRGDGTFADVTPESGTADPQGRSLGATFCDFDGDGWLDLYVCNDVSRDRLFRNLGGEGRPGTFTDISAQAGTADPRSSMGLSVAQFRAGANEPRRLPDLLITHWVAEGLAVYENHTTPAGRLEFQDKARAFGLGEISLRRVGWGCGVADFDLDGRADLAIANGSTLEVPERPELLKAEPMFIFINEGGGFSDVSALAGEATRRPYNGRGLAIADYDRDGRPDFAFTTTEGQVVLLHNETPTAHRSLTVRLHGRAAECFGACVEVWVNGERQIRWYGADVSYLSMHATDLVFGLGEASFADRVEVHWVAGKETVCTHVPAGVVDVRPPGDRPAEAMSGPASGR
ncbi:hypothetical protein DB347_11650 [Opitutaceae bacterium EW11]|nr:hypothetical protein DB347_11650 [Opitutaceae bacterium EW11]